MHLDVRVCVWFMVNYAYAGKTQKEVKLSPLHGINTCNEKGKLWTQVQLI